MSISALLDLAAAAYDDRVALAIAGDGLTYTGLADRVMRSARVLDQHQGSDLAFVGPNGPGFLIALFAAAHLGRTFVPLNYRLSPDALAALLGELDDPLVLTDTPEAVPAGHRCLDLAAWSRLARQSEPAEARRDVDPVAVLLFTSGTTAAPKGVLLSHEKLTSYVLNSVEFAVSQPDETVLVSVPPYHIAGIASALTNVYAGRRIVHLPVFSASGWLDLVRRERVTSTMLVPTMLARIVEHLDGSGSATAGTPSLRSLAYGGAALPPRVLRRALELFPEAGFTNGYGLTETSSTIAVLDPDDHRAAVSSADPAVRARLASAGRPIPGIEVCVRDADGTEILDGRPGDLYVRGAQVSGQYLRSGSHLDADGWFATRDRARQDKDGYLFIEGRTDDTIIRGAENIAPAEIENALRQHPEVRDVAVVGLPDEEWGQRIAAAVVLAADASAGAAELKEWVRSRLRSSKTPDLIAVVPALPYSATGKMLRREVAADLRHAAGNDRRNERRRS